MAMAPYNGDLSQALKWMQNNAPAIQTLVRKKADWYSQYHDQFWTDWQTNVFDLRTANPFGLMVWCIILGVPSSLFGLYPDTVGWAYGQFRQNFVYSGTDPNLPNPNLVGGNFAGGGNTTLLNLNEVRYALRLRYAALVSNGSIQEINRMLNYIFNDGEPWDFANKNYFYVADQTIVPSDNVAAINKPMYMEYRIGAGLAISDQFVALLNSQQYGITPSCGGVKYTVIKET